MAARPSWSGCSDIASNRSPHFETQPRCPGARRPVLQDDRQVTRGTTAIHGRVDRRARILPPGGGPLLATKRPCGSEDPRETVQSIHQVPIRSRTHSSSIGVRGQRVCPQPGIERRPSGRSADDSATAEAETDPQTPPPGGNSDLGLARRPPQGMDRRLRGPSPEVFAHRLNPSTGSARFSCFCFSFSTNDASGLVSSPNRATSSRRAWTISSSLTWRIGTPP